MGIACRETDVIEGPGNVSLIWDDAKAVVLLQFVWLRMPQNAFLSWISRLKNG